MWPNKLFRAVLYTVVLVYHLRFLSRIVGLQKCKTAKDLVGGRCKTGINTKKYSLGDSSIFHRTCNSGSVFLRCGIKYHKKSFGATNFASSSFVSSSSGAETCEILDVNPSYRSGSAWGDSRTDDVFHFRFYDNDHLFNNYVLHRRWRRRYAILFDPCVDVVCHG